MRPQRKEEGRRQCSHTREHTVMGTEGPRGLGGTSHVVSPEARCSDVYHTQKCSLLCVRKGDIHHQHRGLQPHPRTHG